MKKILLFSLLFGLSYSGFSQIRDSMIWFKAEIGKVSLLSSKFKTLTATAMNSDDCTPPKGCDIVDPWTCECTGGTKDPWGDGTKMDASRLKAFYAMEKAIANGDGKTVLPSRLVSSARKKYPGDSPRAINARFQMYAAALKK